MHVSSNRPVSEDEKADDVCSRRHLYCDTPVVTSWAVAGQQVVFLHMYLQTRVTLEAFPVATPRGRSSSSHEGELCSAFFSVPLAVESQPLFAFTYQGKKLTYTRMPQGFKHSPHVFNQVLKEDLSDLRLDSTLMQYVDDLLICQ